MIKHLPYLALLQAEGSLTHTNAAGSAGDSLWGELQLYHEGLILGSQGQVVLLSTISLIVFNSLEIPPTPTAF